MAALRPRSAATARVGEQAASSAVEPGFRPTTLQPEPVPQRPNVWVPIPEAGTPVEVTWGEELFQPVQFNMMRVGPFKGATVVRAGESVADATYRLWLELNEVAMRIRDEKVAGYLKALEGVAAQVDRR